jgi:CHAT domain-containing protein
MAGLAAAADSIDHRVNEARIALTVEYRPFRAPSRDRRPAEQRRVIDAALDAWKRWNREPTVSNAHRAGTALLLAGRSNQAITLLSEALERATGEPDLLDAIHRCDDTALLIDFSAAMLARKGEPRATLFALEAAERAWSRRPTPESAWNRALALDQIGVAGAAAAWNDVAARDGTSGWAHEASLRGGAAALRNAPAVEEPFETFFEHRLIEWALRDPQLITAGPAAGDHLAADTRTSLLQLDAKRRARALRAMEGFARARAAFERDDIAESRAAFAAAGREFAQLGIPIALLARDGQIRCECTQAAPACLDDIAALRSRVESSGRFPWLAARLAWATGQTYFRRGRMYEAADWLQRALTGFRAAGDQTSEEMMHSLLANVYAAAGETDLAITHYVEAIRRRSMDIGDRRRRILEDAIRFTLRHDYLYTAGLLLDEAAKSPATPAGRAAEERLRGVLRARLGDSAAAAKHFGEARRLLDGIGDATVRSAARTSLAIAEVGVHMATSHALSEIENAIAERRQIDNSIWLPQLLLERGKTMERRNDALAERDYRDAIDILEQREPRIDQALVALGIGSDRESPFDRAIRLFLRQGRIVDALRVAERAAALRISSLNARSAGFRDVFRPPRASGSDDPVGMLRSSLRPKDAAVLYYLQNDELITWIVTRKDVVVIRQAVRQQTLAATAERLRLCVQHAGCSDHRSVDMLSRFLLRGWIGRVAPEATLFIVAAPELAAVPFSMLETGNGILLTRNAVSTAPTLRSLARAGREDVSRDGPVNAFFAAAPNAGGSLASLPRSAREVSISSRQYARVSVDPHSTRDRFLAQSPGFAIIHFAGHILVNEEQPLLSALAFDRGGLLYVHELDRQCFAHARIVVLSGCDSGYSARPTMSIANALLHQGVPTVVYTLWPIADDAAADFAVAFHRAVAAGHRRADAVREAQLQLMRENGSRAVDWAAFGIVGESGRLTKERGEKE